MDLPWYETFGTVLTAVVAAGAVLGSARSWWRRTLGRRRNNTRALRRLGTNAQHDYFTNHLGGPPAIREYHKLNFGTRDSTGENLNAARLVWVDPDFAVCALFDEEGGSIAYSITSRRRAFHPSFDLPGSGTTQRRRLAALQPRAPERLQGLLFRLAFPPTRISLNRSVFAHLSDEPKSVEGAVWPRGTQYQEAHYYGNPGNYLTYVAAATTTGPTSGIEGDYFGMGSPHGGHFIWESTPEGRLDDVPEVGSYRAQARINTIAFLAQDEPEIRGVLFVRQDEIRTFA